MNDKKLNPNYLFETSWEVCNKIGGIHTVIATKSEILYKEFADRYITVGPDIWQYKENQEFTEDKSLFYSWRKKAEKEGLKIRIGRWNIKGNPIAILVDFSPYINEKDEVLHFYWDKYQLDSLNANWDFTESALFGYAVGKVVESFVNFQVGTRERVICHCHEWMTGSALLYLKNKLPLVGTVFTTHATVLGRSIAGNGQHLYNYLTDYNPTQKAYELGVQHKHFLEAKAALLADNFTTVSEITARECTHFLGRTPDVLTPNGFDEQLLLDKKMYKAKRTFARKKLLEIAENLSAETYGENAFFIGIGGRNEFRNKGIDIFIETLGKLNKSPKSDRKILAFILIPSWHDAPNPDLLENLKSSKKQPCLQPYSTHKIHEEHYNAILNKIREQGIFNKKDDVVNVYFCPSYLFGNDGVFNITYYDLLTGLDLTVFPSYYEPWGYTPLESICFKVPTITTTLAGFGTWVNSQCIENKSVTVIPRNDTNDNEVISNIVTKIQEITHISPEEYVDIQENALSVAKNALWKNFIKYYFKTYQNTVQKIHKKMEELPQTDTNSIYLEQFKSVNQPRWKSVIIHRSTPPKLKALDVLAKNLWWCWNEEVEQLFKSIDPEEWKKVDKNPIALLDTISASEFKALENNDNFLLRLESVYQKFLTYMEKKKTMEHPAVAYFSMEFGLHASLKIYSGGLGILAGDYLKEASDKATKITGVGLLYRYGYFTQKLSAFGDQESEYEAQDFSKIPVSPVTDEEGNWVTVSVDLPGRTLYARVWRVDVGRIELYLLDTDFENNSDEDRSVTHHLYGGNWENRLKQEMLLGLGGIKMLEKLGIQADIYHCNEGHAAFIGLERLSNFINKDKLSFAEATEMVRASSLFTTHTPVPAGHDFFEEGMLKAFIGNYTEKLHVNWEQILSLGKINLNDAHEKFSMSFLAANLSQEVNGVSWLHGEVSRDIFKNLWPGYMPEEQHISYVTNGVHQPTWTATLWKKIEQEYFKKDPNGGNYSPKSFEGIYDVPNKDIVQIKDQLRTKLVKKIKDNLHIEKNISYFTPREIVEIRDNLRDDVLTFGFARRFATYKRAHLLFKNLEKLDAIVNNPERPVQFIFAGKAHPADKAGQDLIKNIVAISKQPRFLGKIIFLPNYDMDLARTMIQGVDVWMNTPTRPQEASGTSGEKAAMNGVMHFSVLDGWWVEGYREDAGWALPQKRTYENQAYQDELDSELIYNIIEDQIAPAFYNKDAKGISVEWVSFIKNTIAKVASNFTTYRMLSDYEEKFYYPQEKRYNLLKENNFQKAIELSDWKRKVSREWDVIRVEKMVFPDKQELITLGNTYEAEVTLNIGGLSADDLGVELVASKDENGQNKIIFTRQAEVVSSQEQMATYKISIEAEEAGVFMLALRVYPKNDLLPHRQDFALVKWL